MFSGIGITQLIIVLVIVLLLFGTKRLKNLGGDLGSAIKGFKGAVKESEEDKQESKTEQQQKNVEADNVDKKD